MADTDVLTRDARIDMAELAWKEGRIIQGTWRRNGDGGLEQGRVKAKDAGTVGAGALREEQDRNRKLKTIGHLPCDFGCARPALTVDKDGSATAGSPAKVGPAGDLRLGDEETWHGRSHDHDVEMAEMVGDDKSV